MSATLREFVWILGEFARTAWTLFLWKVLPVPSCVAAAATPALLGGFTPWTYAAMFPIAAVCALLWVAAFCLWVPSWIRSSESEDIIYYG